MPTSFGVGSLICAGLPEPQNGKQGLRHLFLRRGCHQGTTNTKLHKEILRPAILSFLQGRRKGNIICFLPVFPSSRQKIFAYILFLNFSAVKHNFAERKSPQ